MFYILSLITGILECGWIAFGAVHSMPIWQILCYPLAYHIGNLFPKPFSLEKKHLTVMAAFAVFTGCMTLFTKSSDIVTFVLTCLSLFLTSVTVQSIRSELKTDGNRLLKRIFRVGGFLIAPVVVLIPSIILIASALTALCALKFYSGKLCYTKLTIQNGYSIVMLFHQLHYFFYAHITLVAISLKYVYNYSVQGVILAFLLFCGTWVTYMSVEPLVSKLTSKLLPVFFIGHIGISILLVCMSVVTSNILFIVFWLITGFGGGVVYTISAQAKSVNTYNKNSMTISENIGHTFGLLTATLVAYFLRGTAPKVMLILASSSALVAVISMLFIDRKELSYENIRN